jgi:hypothetical protein
MITPSFSLTATERVLPKLALDFTTATLDPRVTFTRSGNTATYINSSGVITAINADLPRFDYNPTTLICQGLLIEESRTNLLLNSLIDGTSLSAQSVTVAATAYTLSFYGTGSIDLSGTHTATVIGTGTYPSRKTYTFTPTAGSLTLTVTGTIQYAQLEAGAFATSFIPTAGTSVTRNADVATMTGTNFSSWFNATEGTYVVWGALPSNYSTGLQTFIQSSAGTAANRIAFVNNAGADVINMEMITSSSVVAGFYPSYISGNTKLAFAYKLNNTNYGKDGASGTTDTSCAVPTMSQLNIGANHIPGNYLNGYVQKIFYYPQRLINAELAATSK